ncbi:hypothetical protein OESDEN_15902 [Oesophagostomum dentatum]|uniref:Uncharacterized protein n=1 Tax=Oesophagostomum dentatum TaxID=61180 RepID=A0A0B1SKG1_OESDE|nr:hypothetical protein OESDEN_15902 [Oesophagostomum dentatum]
MVLYGFSEYWYSLDDVLSLGGKYNHTLIAEKSKQFCSQRWSHIQAAVRRKLYPKADEDRLKSQCFKSAWITSILHDGFEVDRKNNKFQSAFTIAGQEVQWALGAMIYHMRYFPLRNSATNFVVNRRPHESSLPSSFTLWLLMLAMLALVAMFAFVTLREDFTSSLRRNRSVWSYMMLNNNPSDSTSMSSFRTVSYA